MLAEAIRSIVDLGQKAREVEFHTQKELPRKVFVRVGNELRVEEVPPPDRAHLLSGFDDLVEAVLRMGASSQVFIQTAGVTALLDRNDRRQTVHVSLCETERFKTAQALQQPRKMEPRDAVKLLRFELHGGNVEHMIRGLSAIDFLRTSSGKTNVAHGKESLGRSVEAAVQQADQVDDHFSLQVPIWSNPGFSRYSASVEIGVYLDLEAQKVELRTLADEIARVRNQAMSAVAADLRERLSDKAEVYLGAP